MIDYNEVFERLENEMIDVGVTSEPKQSKGGVFAPSDINLIKDAILFYVQHPDAVLRPGQNRQAVNLLHRLNNRI